jgi:chemotaxis protein MotB
MPKKKGHEEEHVSHERWLVSYADFITLLFAFFVVMYAVSDLNSRKAKQVSQSVRFAMHYAGSGGTKEAGVFSGSRALDGGNTRTGGAVGNMDQWVREATTVYEFLSRDLVEDLEKSGEPTHRLDERGVVITLPAQWLFEPNTSRPTEKANKYLGKLLETAKKFHKDILLSGTAARAKMPAGGECRDTIELQLKRLALLERILTDTMQWPADRVSLTSLTKKSIAGAFASAAQAERSAVIELVLLR